MAVTTVRCVFDSAGLWIAVGRDAVLADNETQQDLDATQIEAGALVNFGHWDATSSMLKAGPPPPPSATALEQVLAAHHEGINALFDDALQHSSGVSHELRDKVQDARAYIHQGNYLRFNNLVTGHTYTITQLVAHATLARQGPSGLDLTATPATIRSGLYTAAQARAAITVPSTYISLGAANPARLTIANIVAVPHAANNLPAYIDGDDGSWIQGLEARLLAAGTLP